MQNQIQACIDTFLVDINSQSASSEWIVSVDSTGMNSTVYIVKPKDNNQPDSLTTSNRGYAIKHATNNYSLGAIKREQTKLAQLVDLASDIVMPKPLGEISKELPLYATTLLPGINGALAMQQCQDRVQRLGLLKAFANTAKHLHSVEYNSKSQVHSSFPFLRLESHLGNVEASNAREWLEHVVSLEYEPQISQKANKSENVTTEETVEALEALSSIKAHLPEDHLIWSESDKLTLVHGDFMLPNCLFQRDLATGQWTVTGVIDLGDAGWGNPRFDLQAARWSIRYNTALAVLGVKKSEELDVNDRCFLSEVAKGDGAIGIENAKWHGIAEECNEAEEAFLIAYGLDKSSIQDWSLFSHLYELYDYYAYE